MGLQLPGELVTMLGMIGLNWPEADEEKLFEMGQVWLNLSGEIATTIAESGKSAQSVWEANKGEAVTAFQNYWNEHGAPAALTFGQNAATGFGIGLTVYAAIVLALKINVIVQLTLLAIEVAQAIAEAVPTFGASLLEIPVFQQLTRSIVEGLIWQVIEAILGG